MGGDSSYDVPAELAVNVSIHAPAWGATQFALFTGTRRKGFNPRPRMGGDLPAQGPDHGRKSFNPRPRMGGDITTLNTEFEDQMVSIHAPAWGATKEGTLIDFPARMFQSTPPHGGRLNKGE